MILDMDKSSIGNEVNHLLDPKTRISNSSRQTQLVLLSQWYPKEVLESLLARFDLQDGEYNIVARQSQVQHDGRFESGNSKA